MTWTQIILILGAIPLLVGYLFGSVNFGVVVSRLLYHEDIRTKGSGNAGTTNILRLLNGTEYRFGEKKK